MMWWPFSRSRLRRESELREEIEVHLTMAARERMERGESSEAAHQGSLREFGNRTLIQEETREAWGWTWMEHLAQDLRYALRQVRRAPGTFASAVLLIALGVAASTQVFAFVDAVLLRNLPVRDPQSLVQLFEIHPRIPARPFYRSFLLRLIREQSSTITSAVGQAEWTTPVEHGGTTERVHPHAVTNDYFSALGVPAALGRVIDGEDQQVAVLSHAYWIRAFGGDPKAVGQTIRLYDRPFAIIGVAARDFVGTVIDSSADLWFPQRSSYNLADNPAIRVDDAYREESFTEILGRLRPGVSISQAQAELAVLFDRYNQELIRRKLEDKAFLQEGRLEVRSIARGTSPLRQQSATALWLLLAGTGLVLVMVCANIGGLLLAKASAREKETAVRLAIGASRGRIARMWFIESLLLAVTGGLAGTLVAYASLPLLTRWLPPARGIGYDPAELRIRALDLSPDLGVLVFSIGVCALVAVLSALAPVWRLSQRNLWTALKTGIAEGRHRRFQSALCSMQIALCIVLLVFAGWMVRSLTVLRATDTGVDASAISIFSLDPANARYNKETIVSYKRRLIDAVKALPDVENAAIAERALMRGIGFGGFAIFPDRPPEGRLNTSFNVVSPEYFDTMGMHFSAGGGFDASTLQRKPAPAVINQEFARRFFPNRDPIGQVFAIGRKWVAPKFQITGVVNDTKYRSLREVPPPIYYVAEFGSLEETDTFILHVRARGNPRAVISDVRKLAASIDPRVSLYETTTLTEEIDRSLWQERMLVAMAGAFGVFAMVLTAIGLYGVLAYFVTVRRREIGLRMALGATPAKVGRFVARPLAATVGIGLVLGGALAFAASRWAQSLFYGIGPFDGLSIGLALGLVAVVTCVASAPPCWRAIRLDPAQLLREE